MPGISRSNLESSPGEVLRILVGRWTDVRQDIAARQLEAGPEASGVFARPDESGNRIAMLDADGDTERTLGPGSGLVAAVGYEEQPPTWLITGTDDVGVAAAAAALTEEQLKDRFALGSRPAAGCRCHSTAAVIRRSPLHATRASIGGLWCLALAAIPLSGEHPALLIAVLSGRDGRRPGRGPRTRTAADRGLGRAVRGRGSGHQRARDP